MRLPHLLLLVYAILLHRCFEPLAPTPADSGSFADPGCPESSNLEIYKKNKTKGVSKSDASQGVT
jgi:hypothetical protein